MNGASTRRVWDLPTRLFHLVLIALFAFSWWSAENGELRWHRWSGYTVLTLLLFRLFWGFAGSTTARFVQFVRGPRAFVMYARGLLTQDAAPSVGHNPMGGWSVLAMLLLLLVQTGTGLFAVDTDGVESGPLSHFVSFDAGRTLAELHETSFNLLLVLIGLHIAVVLLYLLYRRDNLITPMLSGRKRLAADPALRFASPALAALLLVVAAALVAALVFGLG